VNDTDGSAARNVPLLARIPPPVQYAVAFLAGVALDRFSPWRPGWMATASLRWAGFALVLAGCALAASAAGRFVLRRTTLDPTGEPSRLVVNGAHARSRNPMYLSLTVAYVGLALALGLAWPLVLVLVPWASMNWITIPFEERRLIEIFGEDYADYCRRVRRWI